MFSYIKSSARQMFSRAEASSLDVDEGLEDKNDKDKIKVYRGTQNPTKAWEEIKVKQNQKVAELLHFDTPVYKDKIRFVCMSDTHNRTSRMPAGSIPPGDVFLHAGDFSMTGKLREIEEFNNFLGSLQHKHKIVIAGNHDLIFDDEFLGPPLRRFGMTAETVFEFLKDNEIEKVSDMLTNCTYIEDSEVEVAGVRIYGSPWQPEFGNWAFNLYRGQDLLDKWNKIPEGIDILMTHGPPIGYGDKCRGGVRAGCVELLNTIQKRVKPKYHIFGHIHESYGVTTDGYTTYINASTCSLRYRPDNAPLIFDIPLPPGCSKDSIVIKSNVQNLKNSASNSFQEDGQSDSTGKSEKKEEQNSYDENKASSWMACDREEVKMEITEQDSSSDSIVFEYDDDSRERNAGKEWNDHELALDLSSASSSDDDYCINQEKTRGSIISQPKDKNVEFKVINSKGALRKSNPKAIQDTAVKVRTITWDDGGLENAKEELEELAPYLVEDSDKDKIKVYRSTKNPTKAWKEIKVTQNQKDTQLLHFDTPVYEDKIRFVCMSDTHNRTSMMPAGSIPPGDVFLHAGDFSMTGKLKEIEEFNDFLGSIPNDFFSGPNRLFDAFDVLFWFIEGQSSHAPKYQIGIREYLKKHLECRSLAHKHKIVIAGNHDLTFDTEYKTAPAVLFGYKNENIEEYLHKKGLDKVSDMLTDCTYLEDSEAVVAGIRIYGSPWQPEFRNWAFNLYRGQDLLDKWNQIPEGIDILITHGPPIGYGDMCFDGIRAGCVELLNTIQKRVKPKYHIFGHIHEGYGVTTDGYTTYINASTCSLRYRPENAPIIFDIPLPPGCSKDSIVIKSNVKNLKNSASKSLQGDGQNDSKSEKTEEEDSCDENKEVNKNITEQDSSSDSIVFEYDDDSQKENEDKEWKNHELAI